jgi:hypothetical protein
MIHEIPTWVKLAPIGIALFIWGWWAATRKWLV